MHNPGNVNFYVKRKLKRADRELERVPDFKSFQVYYIYGYSLISVLRNAHSIPCVLQDVEQLQWYNARKNCIFTGTAIKTRSVKEGGGKNNIQEILGLKLLLSYGFHFKNGVKSRFLILHVRHIHDQY